MFRVILMLICFVTLITTFVDSKVKHASIKARRANSKDAATDTPAVSITTASTTSSAKTTVVKDGAIVMKKERKQKRSKDSKQKKKKKRKITKMTLREMLKCFILSMFDPTVDGLIDFAITQDDGTNSTTSNSNSNWNIMPAATQGGTFGMVCGPNGCY